MARAALPVVGWRELVHLPDLGLHNLPAKIDTGARTSALHASVIEPFGPADAPQVRFLIQPDPSDPGLEITCSAPVVDRRDVTSSNGDTELRYVIQTDVGPIGVLICYDSEFPELGRHLTDAGAKLFFVPYCTDTRHGHLRVRYCCHARTVENQCYVVTSGLVGTVPNVANMDINFAQSAVLTPSDHPFARDGIAAEATENAETMIIADLDMNRLDLARERGSVRNLNDRRPELYRVEWSRR